MPSVSSRSPVLTDISAPSSPTATAQHSEASSSFAGIFQAILTDTSTDDTAQAPSPETTVITPESTAPAEEPQELSAPLTESEAETPAPQPEVRSMAEWLTQLYPLPTSLTAPEWTGLLINTAQSATIPTDMPAGETLDTATTPLTTAPSVAGLLPFTGDDHTINSAAQTQKLPPFTDAHSAPHHPAKNTITANLSVLETPEKPPLQIIPTTPTAAQPVIPATDMETLTTTRKAETPVNSATVSMPSATQPEQPVATAQISGLPTAAAPPPVTPVKQEAITPSATSVQTLTAAREQSAAPDPENVLTPLRSTAIAAPSQIASPQAPSSAGMAAHPPLEVPVNTAESLTAPEGLFVSATEPTTSHPRLSTFTTETSLASSSAIKVSMIASESGTSLPPLRQTTPQDYAAIWLRTRLNQQTEATTTPAPTSPVPLAEKTPSFQTPGRSIAESNLKTDTPPIPASESPASETPLPVLKAVSTPAETTAHSMSARGSEWAELSLKQQLGLTRPSLPTSLQTLSLSSLPQASETLQAASDSHLETEIFETAQLFVSDTPTPEIVSTPGPASESISPTPTATPELNTSPSLSVQATGTGGQTASQSVKTETAPPALTRPEIPPAIQQFSERIRLMRQEGRHEIRLSLKPAELGKISLQLIQQDQQLKMHILTETVMAKDLLESQIGQLKQALQQQGLHLQQIQIEFNSGESGQSFAEQRHPSHSREQKSVSRGFWSDEDFSEEDSELDLSGIPPAGRDASRQALHVNYLA